MPNSNMVKHSKEFYHRFLDEAGDTTFWGKGKTPIIGKSQGVSLAFILGMVKFKQPMNLVREQVVKLQNEIERDEYLKGVPSIEKKKNKTGFFFHATDDLPEVREKFYKFIKSIDLSFEAVVGRKIYDIFINKLKQTKPALKLFRILGKRLEVDVRIKAGLIY